MTKYKFMTAERKGTYSNYPYPEKVLPAMNGEPIVCRHGWHACDETQVHHWFNFRVAEVEADSWIECDDKCVTVDEVRILREGTLDVVAFAQACANHAQMHAARDAARAARDAARAARDAARDAAHKAEFAWQNQWILEHIQWEGENV